MARDLTTSFPAAGARRALATAAVLAVGAVSCHTFPTDPNATRWDPPPAQDPLGNITGLVLDQVTNQRIAGVRVWAGDVVSISDANGNYNLPSLRGNQVLIQAWKDGYDTTRVSYQINSVNSVYNVRIRVREQ